MARITQQHIQLLENKVKCTSCKKVLFEGVIDQGAIFIECPKCGNSQMVMSLLPATQEKKDDSLLQRLRQIFYR
jgi:predicted RNA-binding Zn-ribbon protein involved in translation (DUF1610 family)